MLPEIKRILFTSDLTASSRHAFQYAASVAGRFCADIVFLYVMEEISMSARAFLDDDTIRKIKEQAAHTAQGALIGKQRGLLMLRNEIQRFCECSMDEIEKNGSQSVDTEVVIVEGNVVDTIIATAEAKECDTILMGSARRGPLLEAMLGSVVKGVMRRSGKLVIVAPPPPQDEGL